MSVLTAQASFSDYLIPLTIVLAVLLCIVEVFIAFGRNADLAGIEELVARTFNWVVLIRILNHAIVGVGNFLQDKLLWLCTRCPQLIPLIPDASIVLNICAHLLRLDVTAFSELPALPGLSEQFDI